MILGAEDKLYALEYELYSEVRETIAAQVERIQKTAKAVAGLDVFTSLALVAERNHYVRPKINEKGIPVPALIMTVAVGLVTLAVNYVSPDKVYVWLMSVVGLAIVFSWFGIAISHLYFRKWLVKNGGKVENLKFKIGRAHV